MQIARCDDRGQVPSNTFELTVSATHQYLQEHFVQITRERN